MHGKSRSNLDELSDHFAARFKERLPTLNRAVRRELAHRILRGMGVFTYRGDIIHEDLPRRMVLQ